MPRPKSDLEPVQIKLGDADRDLLDRLAKHVFPPTRTQVIREAIRLAAPEIRRQKKSQKISP